MNWFRYTISVFAFFLSPLSGHQFSLASSRDIVQMEWVKDGSRWSERYPSYPNTLSWIFDHLLSWSPASEGQVLSRECSLQNFKVELQSSKSPKTYAEKIENFWQNCRHEIQNGVENKALHGLKMLSFTEKSSSLTLPKPVVFHIGPHHLKGLFYLKEEKTPLPLVILRLGLFANINDFRAERFLISLLFHQAPFHLLVLESSSGVDYLMNNPEASFAGWNEALENLWIAEFFGKSQKDFLQNFSSLHLFGVSLGGQGVLIASALQKNWKRDSSTRSPLFQSFQALCPVVNLNETFQRLTEAGLGHSLSDLWVQYRLRTWIENSKGALDFEFAWNTPAFLRKVQSWVGEKKTDLGYLAPNFLKSQIINKNFWDLNQVENWLKEVNQPTFVYTTDVDPLVSPEWNSKFYKNLESASQSRLFSWVRQNTGFHCSFPVSTSWEFLRLILQTPILSSATWLQQQ